SPVTFEQVLLSKLTNVVKSPRQALKQVTILWVVLSGLRKVGFPVDIAVGNLPTAGPGESVVPFVTETGGYAMDSGVWWGPADASGPLVAAVGQASQLPEQQDRIAMLN